jgi:hypothetical protein
VSIEEDESPSTHVEKLSPIKEVAPSSWNIPLHLPASCGRFSVPRPARSSGNYARTYALIPSRTHNKILIVYNHSSVMITLAKSDDVRTIPEKRNEATMSEKMRQPLRIKDDTMASDAVTMNLVRNVSPATVPRR